jgi:predicted nucleic acid-binding protein
MIYLDSSALVKLYLMEQGSEEVHAIVVCQEHPLPVTPLAELELLDTLHFKVYLGEMRPEEAEHLEALYRSRRHEGLTCSPAIDQVAFRELCLQPAERTASVGTCSLDVTHVAAARLCGAKVFVTCSDTQAKMAESEGFDVKRV